MKIKTKNTVNTTLKRLNDPVFLKNIPLSIANFFQNTKSFKINRCIFLTFSQTHRLLSLLWWYQVKHNDKIRLYQKTVGNIFFLLHICLLPIAKVSFNSEQRPSLKQKILRCLLAVTDMKQFYCTLQHNAVAKQVAGAGNCAFTTNHCSQSRNEKLCCKLKER